RATLSVALAPLVAMGVALLVGQRGLGRCARGWCDCGVFWGGPVVAEGGLHQVGRGEGPLQPSVGRHSSTIVNEHNRSPTIPKPYYLAPTRRATPYGDHGQSGQFRDAEAGEILLAALQRPMRIAGRGVVLENRGEVVFAGGELDDLAGCAVRAERWSGVG